MYRFLPVIFAVLTGVFSLNAQHAADPSVARELRYQPVGTDFVITNGKLRFNRALYGTNTAFRVEAGDLPEFALYLPGMGGNLKFGVADKSGSKWLIDARRIKAAYRSGSMIYTISDEILGKGTFQLTVLPLADAEGLILKIIPEKIPSNLELLLVYGGISGRKFSRDGDLGADPESSFYLKPENCVNNVFQISGNAFTVQSFAKTDSTDEKDLRFYKSLSGVFPMGCSLKTSDAGQLHNPEALYKSAESRYPVLSGKVKLHSGKPLYALISNTESIWFQEYNRLPAMFDAAEAARKTKSAQISIHTPDPFWNTVGGAISIAADAVWEEPSYLHGANAWRMRLNGWRGAYAADALGWHDRAQMHFNGYARAQYTEPPTGPNVPDPKTNLARQEEKAGNSIFTEGYISRNPDKISPPHHYDMNLVFIDQLLRHFSWTGDTAYLRRMWPVIGRHLAWEKRCFDGNNDGLYDAYASIWASDALQYSGGGVTHSSAYNYFANKTAAQLAALIGKNPSAYEAEASRILTALNQNLWMPEKGWFAEYKDLLGLQKLHPAAALWTVYHAIDSEVTDPFQAWQCLRYVDTAIPHIPVKADGISGSYYTLSTTNWMPYAWSINNVALGEVFHTALAYWQTGRNDEAFRIAKGTLLDYMYLGSSPGNFGQLSYYDDYRGELYRDFADGIGIASRAIIEGLFGIRPDATRKQLTVCPGFPAEWDFASLKTPDIALDFSRNGAVELYRIGLTDSGEMTVKLRIKARRTGIKSLMVNGKPVNHRNRSKAIGQPEIEIECPTASAFEIKIEWQGTEPEKPVTHEFYAKGSPIVLKTTNSTIGELYDPQQIFTTASRDTALFSATISGKIGHRTAFLKLRQGDLEWWNPLEFEIREPLEIVSARNQAPGKLIFSVRNNTSNPISGEVSVKGFSAKLTIQGNASSAELTVPEIFLVPGDNQVIFRSDKFQAKAKIRNWNVDLPSGQTFETVDLNPHFNDKLTHLFENNYLSPRSPYPTLSIPTKGIGDWCSYNETEEIDDSGIRKLAGSANTITLHPGIPFATPGKSDLPNILFSSQWDNYPDEITVPLSGKAVHAYFLMAGSAHHMQSRIDNGELIVEYTDGSSETLVLRNPETWWPVEQDYYQNGTSFDTGVSQPPRLHLKTGELRLEPYQILNKNKNNRIEGGAATVLDLPLNPEKELKQLRLKTLANDVVIGVMAVTLVRE